VVIALEGKAQVTISGDSLSLKEGEMVIMPADEPHVLRALKKFKMLLIMIRTDLPRK
jgi:quercetin dioxygenase-like cupin family protein